MYAGKIPPLNMQVISEYDIAHKLIFLFVLMAHTGVDNDVRGVCQKMLFGSGMYFPCLRCCKGFKGISCKT